MGSGTSRGAVRLRRQRAEFQFVEIPTDPAKLTQISDAAEQVSPSYETMLEDLEARHTKETRWDVVLEAAKRAAPKLTERQRQIVFRYFFAGETEEQIAKSLNVSHQTVSESLFGRIQKGKRIGGAIADIRRAFEGLTPCKKTHR
jgi:DNA-directed RNA polymerase specialized sigma subunit